MELVKNRQGFLVSETERQCTNCRSMFPNTSKTVTLCPKCNTTRVKSQSAESKMYQRAKTRSKDSGVPFSISMQDIVIPEICPVLKIPLVCHSGGSGGRPNSPALDRIKNELGYVPGNVRVISHMANMMKSSASEETLRQFCQSINCECHDTQAGTNDSR